jgi:DNA-damage-inducible protein J
MAMEEAKLIMAGKIPAKRYASVHELLDELETDGE